METGVADARLRDLRGGAIHAGNVGVSGRHRAAARGIPAGVEARVRLVHPGRTDAERLRRDRESGESGGDVISVALGCQHDVAAGITDPGGRLCCRAGARFSERGLAALHAAVCGGGKDGVDELSAAVSVVHFVFLSLYDWAVRENWAGCGACADGRAFWSTGCGQQLVVAAVPLWADRMVVARNDVQEVPLDAERGSAGRDGRAN